MPHNTIDQETQYQIWHRVNILKQKKAQVQFDLKVGLHSVNKYSKEPPPGYTPQQPQNHVNTPTPPVVSAAPQLPLNEVEINGATLPDSWARPRLPLQVDTPGWWGVSGDQHIPMHHRETIEAFVSECKAKNANVLINGDFMDMFGISPFFRIPTEEKFKDEIDAGKQALRYIRAQLPKARIIYREGNHEFRLTRFIVDRAGPLWGLPCLELPSLLELDELGIEWVQDKRLINIGKLHTLHGHELRKGEGVNPARLAFLRTTASVLVSHYHRTSEHHQRSLDDKHFATFSIGCSCFISPDYDPYNQWNLGYAMVEVSPDGWYGVHNRRSINGRVV